MNSLQSSIESLEQQIIFSEQRETAIINKDWKKFLETTIQEDKIELDGIKNGTLISGEDTNLIQSRIEKNELLLENNIKPINEEASIETYNFIKLVFTNFVPLIIIILLLVFSSDFVSSELDEGTFKFLLIQPLSRRKILLSKIIACNIICLSIIVIVFTTIFLTLGLIKGFGNINYPVIFNTENFSSVFNGANTNNISFTNIKTFDILIILFMPLLILAITSIGILMSTLIGNSIGAMTFSIIAYIAYYIFNLKFYMFKQIAQYIPFTYCNIPEVLDGTAISTHGNNNITYLNGIIVLSFTTIICSLLSYCLFRKKDII